MHLIAVGNNHRELNIGGNLPIYEYECEQEKHRFEKWQSVNDEPLKVCPVCGSPVHKIFHPAGIIFKGSGWYITDSRKPASSSESSKGEDKAKSEDKPKSTTDKPSSESK